MAVQTLAEYREMGWGDRAVEFHNFMVKVDNACMKSIGLGIYDLPDQDFASAFEDEMDPKEFLDEVLENEGFVV